MSKKRGRLNKEETNFITRNVHEMSVEDIANSLNRTEEVVKKFIAKRQLKPQTEDWEVEQDVALRGLLRQQPYWPELQEEFIQKELEYFEDTWVELMKQFREDVLYSESWGGIKQWITLDIMMHRALKEHKEHLEELEKCKEDLRREEKKDPEERDATRLLALTQEIGFLRSAIGSYASTHTKLLNEVKFISKSLKANRDERIKRIEDGKTSWQGFLRMLEDEKVRQRIGEDAELMKLAKDKGKERLSAYHTYEDSMVDRPFLTPETVTEEG